MNGYLVGGKVLTCRTLEANARNPFTFSSAKKYKFINWKRIFMKNKNKEKSKEEKAKEVSSLLKK